MYPGQAARIAECRWRPITYKSIRRLHLAHVPNTLCYGTVDHDRICCACADDTGVRPRGGCSQLVEPSCFSNLLPSQAVYVSGLSPSLQQSNWVGIATPRDGAVHSW